MVPFTPVHFRTRDGMLLYYRDYAGADGLPVLCLPGLTRNSADFAVLAARLNAFGHRVLCLDFRGRGLSAYDPNFMNYTPSVYVTDIIDLLAHAGVERAVFIGTSLGGIVTQLVGLEHKGLIAGAVLNDIGPELSLAGLASIAARTGQGGEAETWEQAVAEAKAAQGAFFPKLTQAEWEAFARRLYVEKSQGGLRLNYDPKIGDALRGGGPVQSDLWPIFEGLSGVPLLLLRGALSDLLAPETVARMKAARPDLTVVEIPDQGHAPLLDEPVSLGAITRFVQSLAAP